MIKNALLVVGHGSKSPDAVNVFNNMIKLINDKCNFDLVEGAHMELSKPDIESVVHALAEQKVSSITIAPYFLYEGIHIKKDIPNIVKKLSEKYENIDFMMAMPIGYEPLLADIIIKRANEAKKIEE